MNKIVAFLCYGYIGGLTGQFIYLNFFHPLTKLNNAMFNLGLSIVWSIGRISPPWWVWLMAIVVGGAVAFSNDNENNE